MKLIRAGMIIMLIIICCIKSNSQSEHKWKALVVNELKKVWVDEASLDSAKGTKIEVWLLQMHVPPITMDGIKGEVYRAKTLFAVNLETVKYGIEKVIYYNAENAELYNFDYGITDFEDNLKYTYPVLENSSIHMVIKELYKKQKDKSN